MGVQAEAACNVVIYNCVTLLNLIGHTRLKVYETGCFVDFIAKTMIQKDNRKKKAPEKT